MHVCVEIFSFILVLYAPLLTLSKHKGEKVHNNPRQMKITYCRARNPSSTQFRKTQQVVTVKPLVQLIHICSTQTVNEQFHLQHQHQISW